MKYVRSATRGQRRTRWPLDIQVKGDESDRETWRVLKMKWAKRKDPETGKNVNDVTKLIYNKRVTIAGIPAEADEYMLGSRSALAWLIDRYQVKKIRPPALSMTQMIGLMRWAIRATSWI